MKKLLMIVLMILIVFFVMDNITLGKARFGSWDYWDKFLPPWDNEDWFYSEESLKIISIPPVGGTRFWFCEEGQEQWRSIKVGGSPLLTGNEEVLLVLTCLAFKSDDQKTPITIFSPAPISKDFKGIEEALATAEIAIAVFPPEKGKELVVRSYEKKDGLLQFFKKWTVTCENRPIIPEKYEDWFVNRSQQLTEEKILPQLVVFKTGEKKSFFIGVSVTLLKEFLIKEKVPGIKKESVVVF